MPKSHAIKSSKVSNLNQAVIYSNQIGFGSLPNLKSTISNGRSRLANEARPAVVLTVVHSMAHGGILADS